MDASGGRRLILLVNPGTVAVSRGVVVNLVYLICVKNPEIGLVKTTLGPEGPVTLTQPQNGQVQVRVQVNSTCGSLS